MMFSGDLVGRRAQLAPDKVALVDTLNENEPITYGRWSRQINQTAHWLHESLGVRQGDRVAILAMNCVAYLDVLLACGRLGAIVQNLNWRLTAVELRHLLRDAEPRVLIYGPDFLEPVAALRDLSFIHHWVSLNDKIHPNDASFNERDTVSLSLPLSLPPSRHWDDPWVICYTGGTTGLPKGAVLTHRSMLFNAFNTIHSWGLTADDTAILNAPLFHTGGINVFTLPLLVAGGTSIVCRGFDAEQVFDLVAGGDVSLFFGVPTMFIMMQQHPRWPAADFSRLKLVISGGAPCPAPVFEKFFAKEVEFKTGYGLTEAGPNNFWLPPADVRRKAGYVGRPLLFVDVKVVRANGVECEDGEVGELIISGPHLCAGYWNNPAATAAAIHPSPSDESGRLWLHTGDAASRDEEGDFRIADRLKDMFISGGENVYPAEIESVLHAHPAVAEAAVIGGPDEKWGEVGTAYVVLNPDQTASAADLLTFCRQRLAAYKVPKSVVFMSNLPKTAAGKIQRQAIQQLTVNSQQPTVNSHNNQ
jgi:fatty-acyl-CoA synthase